MSSFDNVQNDIFFSKIRKLKRKEKKNKRRNTYFNEMEYVILNIIRRR